MGDLWTEGNTMAPPRRWTNEDTEKLLELHKLGKSASDIARTTGWSVGTISRRAAREGVTFDRSMMEVPIQANRMDIRVKREQLKEHLISDALKLREQLWEPYMVYNIGGSQNIYTEREMPQPPSADKAKLMNALTAAVSSYDRLEKLDADGGVAEAIGMIDRLRRGIDIAAKEIIKSETAAKGEEATKRINARESKRLKDKRIKANAEKAKKAQK